MKNENKNTTEQNNVKPRLKYNNNKKEGATIKPKKNIFTLQPHFVVKTNMKEE